MIDNTIAAWIIVVFLGAFFLVCVLPSLRRVKTTDKPKEIHLPQIPCSLCNGPCKGSDEFCSKCKTCGRCGAQKDRHKVLHRYHGHHWELYCPNCDTKYCGKCQSKQLFLYDYDDYRADSFETCQKCGRLLEDIKPHAFEPQSRTSTPEERDRKDKEDAILAAASRGDRIIAMKLYREIYGGSLADAKTFIDKLLS